jgi:hypothetical protein
LHYGNGIYHVVIVFLGALCELHHRLSVMVASSFCWLLLASHSQSLREDKIQAPFDFDPLGDSLQSTDKNQKPPNENMSISAKNLDDQ